MSASPLRGSEGALRVSLSLQRVRVESDSEFKVRVTKAHSEHGERYQGETRPGFVPDLS